MSTAQFERARKREWNEVLWSMAGGKTTEFEKIKAMDIIEFYSVMDLWTEEMKVKNSKARQREAQRQR